MAGARTAPRAGERVATLIRHWPRVAISLIPVLFALLHATGVLELGLLHRLDHLIYDARLRASMPRTLDERIVIVDIDEKSLAEVGRWPWPRDRMANLAHEIFARQEALVAGFDVVFSEPDDSSGLKRLRQLSREDLRDEPGFVEKLRQLEHRLDHDALFAQALQGRPVVLGFYFTSDREGGSSGVLPEPVGVMNPTQRHPARMTTWNGYGANIEVIAGAAPHAGFFNAIADPDGVVRSAPVLAEYKGRVYESLALALFRRLIGFPDIELGPEGSSHPTDALPSLDSVRLTQDGSRLAIPVDDRAAALVPFRGAGGPKGGSFRYHAAADVLAGRLPAGLLKDKIVLFGTTAPGLLDLRTTPVSEAYPGVEIHANLISGLLDGRVLVKPDYALGYDVFVLLLVGIGLAFGLPWFAAVGAMVVSGAAIGSVVALNSWLFLGHGLVLPLASALAMAVAVVVLNMGYGFWVESRTKRELAHLFGTYVPPELVEEMVKDPDRYTMQATAREMTVMFCDMRGFTRLSERMDPGQLQRLLNELFSRLTRIIRHERGTVDKYMGDCIMAFWGAPVESGEHASQAVRAALAMVEEIRAINQERVASNELPVALGIGLHTGLMCVGDMGSDVRRSYTVVGDAVNLGSRLEGLTKTYGVDIIASHATRKLATGFRWQELDRVRVKGREQVVTIYRPLPEGDDGEPAGSAESTAWEELLKSYRAQDWEQCELCLLNLIRLDPRNVLYHLYAERVARRKSLPRIHGWDGATDIETK